MQKWIEPTFNLDILFRLRAEIARCQNIFPKSIKNVQTFVKIYFPYCDLNEKLITESRNPYYSECLEYAC